ncbi:MAG: D-alanyl-D-alanine carboxypeptidase family protein [Clostridia bacterium]|nr:D-alanyl-D-alanine carboxypeptidase family protein [Clostridia bacterium]
MATAGNGGRTPKRPSPQAQNGKTKPFSTVNYRDARLAKERQRRQYEQQKKEKIIFALFVVIIIVLILIAILVFKNAIDKGEASDTNDTGTDTTTGVADTKEPPEELDSYLKEMCAKDQIYKGDLIFVDSTHSFTATPEELTEIYTGRTKFPNASGTKPIYSYYTPDITPKLSGETLTALNKMADEFYETTGNNDLYVNKAYDAAAQNDHATGLAFDLSVYTIDGKLFVLDDEEASSDFAWVFSNYYKYGFIMQSPEQSGERYYHFRYVGIPAATYMFKANIGLDAFLKLLREQHAFADGKTNALSVTTDDGGRYEMYYVEATGGDMTSVPVPEDTLFFSISGDNQNGFIVTARMG